MRNLKTERILLYSVVFLLPLIIWHGTFFKGQIKYFFPQTIALACFILLLTKEKSIALPNPKTFVLAVLFLFSAVISLIFSRYRNSGISNLPPFITAIFLFYIASTVLDRKSVGNICDIWLFAGAIFSIHSILRFLKIVHSPSLIGNPNLEAGYLILTFPLALTMFVYEYEEWKISVYGKERSSEKAASCRLHKIGIYGFLVILFSTAAAITLSRGATIGIVAGVFVLGLCYKKIRSESASAKKFPVISTALLILIIAGSLFLIPVIKRGNIDRMGTLGIRLRIWKATVELIREKPLAGWGFGTFILSYGHHGTPRPFSLDIPRHAHCEPLQVLSEMGFPGLLIFLLLFYFLFREGFEIMKFEEPRLQSVLAGFMGGIAGLLSHNLVSVNLRYPCSLTLMWVAMGVVISQSSKKRLKVRKVFAILLIIISVLLWKRFSFDKFRSQHHLAMGMRYCISEKLGEKRFDKALERFNRAFALSSTEYIAQWMKAQIYEHRLQYGKAIESLHEYEKLFPEFGQLHGWLGDLYLKTGMAEKAIPEFRHAIELTPYVVEYYVSLGTIYSKKEAYGTALEVYDRALTIGLIHPAIYNNIGNIYFARSEFEKALQFYKIANVLSPEDEGILYNLKQAEGKITNIAGK